jgi:hypothetical protein
MTRSLPAGLAVALGLALASASAVHAAPPQIKGITPYGATRGTDAELTVDGANLAGNPRLIAPFRFAPATPPPAGSDASHVKFKVTIDPATPVGVYAVRVQTDDGLSNPFLFAVGQLPQVSEKEDNSVFESAQKVPAPVVIEGQAAGNDVDYFRFPGKKGQKIVVDAQCSRIGSGVDPSIRLTTAGRTFVASADDTPGLLTDARLFATLPEDGDYVVEISDSRYQGGGRPIYRLVVGELPVAEEVYPLGARSGETVGLELRGGTIDGPGIVAARVAPLAGVTRSPVRAAGSALGLTGPRGAFDVESLPALIVGDLPELREPADPAASPVRGAAPVTFNGRIDPAGDEDRFALAVTPGQKLRIEVEAAALGSALDGVLRVLNAQGGVLATADDTTTVIDPKKNPPPSVISPDPSLDFTVPAGLTEVTLALRDLEARGGTGFPYRITVVPATPTFELSLNDPEVSVPKGGTASVPVTIVRKGYNGPITLKLLDPPPGLTARPGTVADGQTVGVLTLSAAADATFGLVSLNVVGEGAGPTGPFTVKAGKTITYAQQAILPTNVETQVGLAAAPAGPLPLSLDAPAGPIEVAHGFGVPVPVKAVRGKDGAGALAVTALPLPPGLTVPKATIAEKAGDANVTVTTTADVPLGKMTVGLAAKGKVAGTEQTFAVPAVTIEVVRPAAVELSKPAVEVKAGETIEVQGKVVRRGGFKEEVTVKADGLPAGVKAEPVKLAADASEFTLKLVADAKAAAATASAKVTPAFQVNKKDYPSPAAPLAVKVLPAK